MAIIQLIVVKIKIFITKYIDVKLFTFLYSKDMLNQDFYLINYLFSFRKIIDSITSKVKNVITYINKKIK